MLITTSTFEININIRYTGKMYEQAKNINRQQESLLHHNILQLKHSSKSSLSKLLHTQSLAFIGKMAKLIICLFFVATVFNTVNSARLLDQVDPQPQVINNNQPGLAIPATLPTPTNLPTTQIPAVTVPVPVATGAPVAATNAASIPVATTPTTVDTDDSTQAPVAVTASAPAAGKMLHK